VCLQGLKKYAKILTSGGGSLCSDRTAKRGPSEYIVCLEIAGNDNCVMWPVLGGRRRGARLRRGASLRSGRTQF